MLQKSSIIRLLELFFCLLLGAMGQICCCSSPWGLFSPSLSMGVTGLAVFPCLFFFLKTSSLLFFFRKRENFSLRFYSAFLLLFPPFFLFVKGYFETLQKVIR